MNYIREIRAFYDWLLTNPIPAHAQSLWHALMHVANKTGWKKEFTVANSTFLSMLGISQAQLTRMRNVLIGKGLISYAKQPGRKAPKYSMISVVAHYEQQPEQQPEQQTDNNQSTLLKLNNKQNKTNNNPSKADFKKEFEELWERYPNRKGKAIAQKRFVKLREKLSFEELTRTVERYAEEVNGKDKQYLKHGSTFFNGGYEDYLDKNYRPHNEQTTKHSNNDVVYIDGSPYRI